MYRTPWKIMGSQRGNVPFLLRFCGCARTIPQRGWGSFGYGAAGAPRSVTGTNIWDGNSAESPLFWGVHAGRFYSLEVDSKVSFFKSLHAHQSGRLLEVFRWGTMNHGFTPIESLSHRATPWSWKTLSQTPGSLSPRSMTGVGQEPWDGVMGAQMA